MQEEYDEEYDEEEAPRRRFPFGCLILLLFVALVAFGGFQVMQLYQEIDGAPTLGEEQTIEIEQGSSVAAIADQLEQAGIVEHGWLFQQYVKFSGLASGIQYGEFALRSRHGL